VATAAPVAAAAPPAAQPPPQVEFDASRASVAVDRISSTTLNPGLLRQAMPTRALTACYQSALRARGRAVAGSASLSILVDASGKIIYATLGSASWLPEMASCVESAPIDTQLRAGSFDEGGGSADVLLTFRSE
jgi:hypothetical protein